MTATFTVAAERQTRQKRHWTDRIGLSVLSLSATSCVAMLAIALAYAGRTSVRSEEHTSELQSQLTISYAVFCL